MSQIRRFAAAAATTAALVAAAPAPAAPVSLNVRVEGSSQTLYEGPVTTDAKMLTKDGSGAHPCDGTNGGANASAGPTLTSAMDDGSIAGGFTWDATWDGGYQDFFISRIGPDTNTGAPDYQPYWGYFDNWVASQVGGCQQEVAAGDDVLFAYADYGQPLLQLTAPARAATGESFQVTVQANDGNGTRTPALAASVAGASTDSSGHATVSFADAGNHTFKATRSDAIRSNAATVCVYAPGSGDCGTDKAPDTSTPPADTTPPPTAAAKDTTPPNVTVGSVQPGKTYSKGPRVLSGTTDDSGGIQQVFLRLRATNGGELTSASRCRWFSGKRGVFTHRTVPCSRARFFRVGSNGRFSYLLPSPLGKGRYVLDVKVLDKSYNAGRVSAPFGVK